MIAAWESENIKILLSYTLASPSAILATSINQPKADATQIANAPGMVHSSCSLLTSWDFLVRSMYLLLEDSGEESHKTHYWVH